MKTRFSTKTIAMGTATGLLVAGIAAIGIPAIAANNGHKAAATKSVGKAKTTKATPKGRVAAGATAPTVPPAPPVGDDYGDGDGDFGRGPGGPDMGPGMHDGMHDGMHEGRGPGGAQALKDTLAELVTKGTLSQEQSDAITSALDAKRTAADAKRAEIRAKADAIIAEVLGLTVEEFKTKATNHTLPTPTAEQMQQIQTKLAELRTSLGLPAEPQGGFGMGRGHRGGPGGHGRRGGHDGPGMGFGPMPGTASGSGA